MTDQTSSDRGCIPTSEPQLQSSYGAGRRAVTQHPPLKHFVRHVTPNNVGELGDPEAHFRCNLLSLVHLLAHGFRQMLHCGRLPPPHTDPWNFLQLLANPCPFALPQHLLRGCAKQSSQLATVLEHQCAHCSMHLTPLSVSPRMC